MGKPIRYNEVKIIERDAVKFGDPVFDEFISEDGGVQLSTMIALSGTSGAGKTTLCKKWQSDLKADEYSVFYALESRKESVARQTKRVKTKGNEYICDDADFATWTEFMQFIYTFKPLMVIVDSLQHAAQLMSLENGKHKYKNYAKIIKDLYTWKDETGGIVILICQLNAKGIMEGPASTIFDVDCPIQLTADPVSGERYMKTEKNRMGTTGKIFYEFTKGDECIKFYTEAEWELTKSGISFPEMMQRTIETYLKVLASHKNYKAFRKDFMLSAKRIYESDASDIEVVAQIIQAIERLTGEHKMR